MSRTALAFALALVAACAAPSNPGVDAGTGSNDACSKPFDACHPPSCAPGNDKGVGQYCSPGGGECDALNTEYDGAYGCGVDLDPEGSDFCVRLFCHTNEECGQDACCTGKGDSGPRGCVPKACVVAHPDDPCPAIPVPTDGGTDADGGSGDVDGGT